MYNGKPFFKIPRPLLLAGGVEVQTLDADLQLEDRDSLFQIIDGGVADRVINLPALKDGRVYAISNNGATNALNVKDIDDVDVVALAAGEFALIVCDGQDWYPILNVNNLP